MMRKIVLNIGVILLIISICTVGSVGAYSPVGSGRPTWPGSPANVIYAINANFGGAAAGTPAQQQAAIQAAAAAWNATGRFNLTPVNTGINTVAQDGTNVIFARNAVNGNALATTLTWWRDSQIIEFDIVFWQGQVAFAVPAQLGPGNFDIQSIALHELGHGLGLGHTTGRSFQTSQWTQWDSNPNMHVLSGDFNGDGMDDVMKIDVPSSGYRTLGLWVGISDGTKFNTSQWTQWDSNPNMHVLSGDFNGDGLDDVMKIDVPSSGYRTLGLWVGQSQVAANPVMAPAIGPNTIVRALTNDELNALTCYYR
jgi:hypothetical protein